MAKIQVNRDVTNLENGTYKGTIAECILCKNGNVMLKIKLDDERFFISFHDATRFGSYPFNHLFMTVDSDELESIKGLNVEFEILNNKSQKTNIVFSNIKKIRVID